MLTEKEYCDYDTCVALKKLGFNNLVDWYFNEEKSIVSSLARYRNTYIPKISLFEAQKFLREEKKIIVEAGFNLMYKGQPRFSYRVLYNLTQHKGSYYTFDSVKSKEDYDSYEEALSEGIKRAVKILEKEEEKIHLHRDKD